MDRVEMFDLLKEIVIDNDNYDATLRQEIIGFIESLENGTEFKFIATIE